MALCEKCKARDLKAMRALESLTPSGSEFVNEVARCVEFVREHHRSQMTAIVRLTKERKAFQEQIAELEQKISDLKNEVWETAMGDDL